VESLVFISVPRVRSARSDSANRFTLCFLGALKYVAGQQKVALPATTSIEGSVGIGQIPTGFGIEVELKISVPGLPREQVEALVQKAHIVCPYSNATRGNIDVKLVMT
jgi:Ohr subfamily peroxiredoxin